MRIHLKDPNYLQKKNYYEKYFNDLKIESFSVKKLIKLYSSKTGSNKTNTLKNEKNKKKNMKINISIAENIKNLENIEKKENNMETKEKINDLFKIEIDNNYNDNIKKEQIKNDSRNELLNISPNKSNILPENINKFSELGNNVVNNNLINVNNSQFIDLLNIINNNSFNYINNPGLNFNNSLNNINYLPINNNIFYFNNNDLQNTLLNNNLNNYYSLLLKSMNLDDFNQSLFNFPINSLMNNNLIDPLNINFGQNISNMNNPSLIKNSKNENNK